MQNLNLVIQQLGIPVFVLVIALAWSGIWKLLALWKAARKRSVAWFIILGLVNTLGILEILYIFIFSECCQKKAPRQAVQRKSRRKRRR
jgi:predicted membrane channel-forming protein YqfA (hemolysin III family)